MVLMTWAYVLYLHISAYLMYAFRLCLMQVILELMPMAETPTGLLGALLVFPLWRPV